MIFQSYVNNPDKWECCPLIHVLWSRQKIPNLSKCVCDTDIWQGRSSAEGAGVVQSDGGVKGKRKVVGTLGLEASWSDETDQWAKDRLWWQERSADRQFGGASLAWQSVSWGVWTACVVTDWLMDERYFLAHVYRTKNKMLSLYVHMSAAICLFVCQRANEAQYSNRLCVITEQVGDLKGTRDSAEFRERESVSPGNRIP